MKNTFPLPYPELSEMTRKYIEQHAFIGMKAFKDGDIDLAVKEFDHTNKVSTFYAKKIGADPQYQHDIRLKAVAVCTVFKYINPPILKLEKMVWPYVKHRLSGPHNNFKISDE